MMACCPLLLYNITLERAPETPQTISLYSSPFGPQPPAIPTARTLTLARIASPFSIDRTYQPLFLRSLKAYFDGTKRLVQKGDMIAIGVNTDFAWRLQETDIVADVQPDVDEGDEM
jgi:peroxin-6